MIRTELFPYVVLRIAGAGFEMLRDLQARESFECVQRIISEKRLFIQTKSRLCEELFREIGSINSSTYRVQLINLKRDIFNERALSGKTISDLSQALNNEIVTDIARYQCLRDELNRLEQIGGHRYNDQLAAARSALQHLAQNEKLLKGLVLSSRVLLSTMKKGFCTRKADDFKKKDFDIEEGIMKYLTRMICKTSPFSTFTHVDVAKLNTLEEVQLQAREGASPPTRRVTSYVRLNNFILDYLVGLIVENAGLREKLHLRINPTKKEDGESISFLTNHYNVEVFQRIQLSKGLQTVLSFIPFDTKGIVYRELADFVQQEAGDVSAAEIRNFIDELIGLGLLEFDMEISGMNPDWDRSLVSKLTETFENDGLIKELCFGLQQIRRFATQLEVADVDDRERILEGAFSTLKSTCLLLHEAAGLPKEERDRILFPEWRLEIGELKRKAEEARVEGQKSTFKRKLNTFFYFRPEQVFYEDTRIVVHKFFADEDMREISKALFELIDYLRRIGGHSDEMLKMTSYFKGKYGKDSVVDFIHFYEDYYREFKKPETEIWIHAKSSNVAPNGGGLPGTEVSQLKIKNQRINEGLSEFSELLHREYGLSGEVRFDLRILNMVFEEQETTVQRTGYSQGVFLQLFLDKKQGSTPRIGAVVNGIFPGYGKMIGRFMHILPPDVYLDLRKFNDQLVPTDCSFAELSDRSFFNANIHPPLVAYEIWIPGAQNNVMPDNRIPVTDIAVKYNEANDALELFHRVTRKRIVVFDLGMESLSERSQLYQLLSRFTLSQSSGVRALINSINAKWESVQPGADVPFWPRICFNGNLILQRKMWLAQKENIPAKKASESDWSYFCRLIEWKQLIGIPDDIFVRIAAPQKHTDDGDDKPTRILKREDRKPQYVDFKSPLLVKLFNKMISRAKDRVIIEEMLPPPMGIVRVGNERVVSECILQWYVHPSQCEVNETEKLAQCPHFLRRTAEQSPG